MALRNMLVRVGADISGLKQGMRQASKEVKYFGRNVTGSMKEIQGKIAGIGLKIGAGLAIKAGLQDAMRYEALMTTLGESLGKSRKDFEKWQQDTGRAMGFSMLQSAELANILSLNFKTISTDTADLTAKTTKMMETAAVISNKRGMTMEEVSDRIRSAMNGEADGADELGVNVRISAMKQSQAYKEMANGTPWDQLSDNMMKTIRYHHILQQVSENLGSTMQDTTAMRMAQFTAVLADLKLGLGQAFLPITYAVLPLLTKLATALVRVMQVVSAFMRSLFGGGFKYKPPVSTSDVKTTQAQAQAMGAVGDEAEKAGKKQAKAGKEAKKAWTGLFGFDEVNTIKDPETPSAGAGAGAGGGGGGAGGGVGAVEEALPIPNTSAFEEQIDKLAQKMKKYTEPIKKLFKQVWDAISTYLKEKLDQMKVWWDENGAQIKEAWDNVWAFFKPILLWLVKYVWESIKGLVDGVITFFQGIIEFFTGIFTGDWQLAWEGLKKIFVGAFQAVTNFFNLTFIGGIKKALLGFIKGGIKHIDDFVKGFKSVYNDAFEYLKLKFGLLVKTIKNNFIDLAKELWAKATEIGKNVSSAFSKIGDAGKGIWNTIKGAFAGAVDWFLVHVINPIKNRFDSLKDAFKDGIGGALKMVYNTIRNPINDAINAINKLKGKIPLISMLPDIGKLPHLARGGITSGPMLAMVGDNPGGREVVAPLDRLQGMLTNAVLQAMQLGGGANAQNSGDVVLNIDGRSFARIVKPFLDKEQSRVGNDVRIRTI